MDASRGAREHVHRIASLVRGVCIGEHLPDVARRGGAEHGVRDRMRNRISVRVSVQMDVGLDADASENQRSTRLEAVRVISDPGTELSHAAAAGTGAIME